MKKTSETFHLGAITIVFWVIFAGMAIKPEKLASRKYAKRKNDARKLGKASTLSLSPQPASCAFFASVFKITFLEMAHKKIVYKRKKLTFKQFRAAPQSRPLFGEQ